MRSPAVALLGLVTLAALAATACGADGTGASGLKADAGAGGAAPGGGGSPGAPHDAAAAGAEEAGGLSGTNSGTDARATEQSGGAAGTDADGAPPRKFRLATTGAQLLVSGPALGLQLTPANVADDGDVISVHQEFYGVPWDAFEAGTPPPAEWVAVMDGLASAAKAAGKPVFLSVSLLNGSRQSLAAKTTIESGSVKTTDSWSASCYDFRTAADGASKKAAYLRYVAYLVDRFAPAYLNLAIEVNLFFEKCPAAAPGVIDVANAAYDAVKQKAPKTLVFPSFQIDHLYGYSKDSCADPTTAAGRSACFDALYAVVAPMHRDRFAMSSYPFMDEIGGVANLPADWFTRGPDRSGETPLIAETGWPSTDIVVRARDGSCPKLFSFTPADSAAYLGRVLADADHHGIDLVTWWSDRDLVVEELMTSCPCSFDATWCTVLDIFRGPVVPGPTDTQLFGELLLKVFGTMGLRTYDGTPRPGHLALWETAHGRPLAP